LQRVSTAEKFKSKVVGGERKVGRPPWGTLLLRLRMKWTGESPVEEEGGVSRDARCSKYTGAEKWAAHGERRLGQGAVVGHLVGVSCCWMAKVCDDHAPRSKKECHRKKNRKRKKTFWERGLTCPRPGIRRGEPRRRFAVTGRR